MRILSMVVMLGVLALLISRAADPNSWRWLTGEGKIETGTIENSAAQGDEADPPAAQIAAQAVPPKAVPPQPERVTPGPTDLDLDEQVAVVEQFEAISDGGTQLGREEMPAYWRLFKWTEHQSLAELRERADQRRTLDAREALLNDFIQNPAEHRGHLFRLELNVRRVLAYPAPENSAGIKTVYEIWGTTPESHAWFLCALTAHLPEGMPVGPDVRERISFAGYFFKVMGYHAAGASPNDKPLPAPVFIGRLSWKPAVPLPRPNEDPPWLWWLAGLFMLFGLLRFGLWFFGSSKTRAPRVPIMESNDPSAAGNLQDWLAEAERDAAQGRAGNRDEASGSFSAPAGQRRPIDFRDN